MKRKVAVLMALLLAVAWVTACAPQAQAPAAQPGGESVGNAGGSKGNIAFLNYLNAHPYFQRGKDRSMQVAAELGYTLTYDGPPDVDTPKFVSMIEDYSSKDIKALIVAALDDTAAPALIAARAKGIIVVTWDADLLTAEARDMYAGVGDYVPLTGAAMAESLVKNIGEEGDYAIVDGDISMHTVAARSQYIEDYLKEKYPKLRMIAKEVAGEDSQKAYSTTQNILTAYPDVKGILVNASSGFAPACKVVEEYGLIGKVFVAGEGLPSICKPGLLSGASKCGYGVDTADWAEFALRVAVNLIEKKEMPEGANPDFKNFPKTVRTGDTMFFGEGQFITPENVDSFGDW